MPQTLLKTGSHSLKLKAYSVTEFTSIYRKLLKLTKNRLRHSSMLRADSVILFNSHLEERPEALIKIDPVADFKNM